MRGELVKSGVSLNTQLAQGLPLIQGDRVQLQQVLVNLIMNAVEAMGSINHGSRKLLIGTGADDSGGVRISVQDSGPGLNPQIFDRVFDPFYTTKADGMGMGLSICRSIIEAHDGRIWASAMPGPGSTFNVSLPGAVDKATVLIGAPVAETLWSGSARSVPDASV
jgi:signal transduction histidine kinase